MYGTLKDSAVGQLFGYVGQLFCDVGQHLGHIEFTTFYKML